MGDIVGSEALARIRTTTASWPLYLYFALIDAKRLLPLTSRRQSRARMPTAGRHYATAI